MSKPADDYGKLERGLCRTLEVARRDFRPAIDAEQLGELCACLRADAPVPRALVERLLMFAYNLGTEYVLARCDAKTWGQELRPFAMEGIKVAEGRAKGGKLRGVGRTDYQALADEYWRAHPAASKNKASMWIEKQLPTRGWPPRRWTTIRKYIKKSEPSA